MTGISWDLCLGMLGFRSLAWISGLGYGTWDLWLDISSLGTLARDLRLGTSGLESVALNLWLGISGLGSLAWDLWLWIFGLGSLAWDLWLWIFGLGSLAWDLWLGIFGLGSLAWDLWLGLFGLGSLGWDLGLGELALLTLGSRSHNWKTRLGNPANTVLREARRVCSWVRASHDVEQEILNLPIQAKVSLLPTHRPLHRLCLYLPPAHLPCPQSSKN